MLHSIANVVQVIARDIAVTNDSGELLGHG